MTILKTVLYVLGVIALIFGLPAFVWGVLLAPITLGLFGFLPPVFWEGGGLVLLGAVLIAVGRRIKTKKVEKMTA